MNWESAVEEYRSSNLVNCAVHLIHLKRRLQEQRSAPRVATNNVLQTQAAHCLAHTLMEYVGELTSCKQPGHAEYALCTGIGADSCAERPRIAYEPGQGWRFMRIKSQ